MGTRDVAEQLSAAQDYAPQLESEISELRAPLSDVISAMADQVDGAARGVRPKELYLGADLRRMFADWGDHLRKMAASLEGKQDDESRG